MPDDPPRTAIALLINYHLERERAYAAFTALIDARATPGGLAAARAALPAASKAWLDDVLARDSEASPLPVLVDLACRPPSVPIRAFALSAASVPARADKVSDLAALARLAGRTAEALRCGEISRAAMLNDLQCAFLRLHAHDCLDELAGHLQRWGGGLHRRLGELLQERLADDHTMFARS